MSTYAVTMISRAEQALAEGRKDEAYNIIKTVLEVEPNNSHAWSVLAKATSDPQEAATAHARELHSIRAVAHYSQPIPVDSYSQPQSRKFLQGGLVIGGAILMGIGSMLPLATISSGIFDSTLEGNESQGTIVLIAASILLITGIIIIINGAMAARIMAIISLIGGVGIACLNIFSYQQESSGQGMRNTIEMAFSQTTTVQNQTSLGPGFIVILVGAIVAFIGACIPKQ